MDKRVVVLVISSVILASLILVFYQSTVIPFGTIITKYFQFLKPQDDKAGIVKKFVEGLTVVNSPYKGSKYWEWRYNQNTGATATYFDLYIPEAQDHDVMLVIVYGADSEDRTGIKVFAFQNKPETWSIYSIPPLGSYKVVYWGVGPVFASTAEIGIPAGYPWIRVWCYDTDTTGQDKVRLWVSAYYQYYTEEEPIPTPTPIPTTPPSQPTPTPTTPTQPTPIYNSVLVMALIVLSCAVIWLAIKNKK